MTTKLKPVEEHTAILRAVGIEDSIPAINKLIELDRHTIYTAMREGIKRETADYADDGGLYIKLEDAITLLDELFGVSK